MNKHKDLNSGRREGVVAFCLVCFVFGPVLAWSVLAFGGIVGGLPYFGLPSPSGFWRAASAYLMAAGLIYFVAAAGIMTLARNHRAR